MPSLDELIRGYVEYNLRPVALDEATSLPLASVRQEQPRRRRATAIAAVGVAAAAALVVGAAAIERTTSHEQHPPGHVEVPAAGDTSTSAPATSPNTAFPSDSSEPAPALITPAGLGAIALEVVSQPGWEGGPFEVREAEERQRDSTTYAFAYLQGAYGRLFVEAYDQSLDIGAAPPYPGNVIALDDRSTIGTTWVWPVDVAFNTAALVSEHQTIVVRSETFEAEPTTGVFGMSAATFDGFEVRMLTRIAEAVLVQVAAAAGTPVEAEPPLTPPSGTTLVSLAELDRPGERVLLDEYQAAIENGPVVGPDGRTFGNEEWADPDPTTGETTKIASPDFIGIMSPDDPRQVIVGFLAGNSRLPGNATKIQLVYGITGDVIGFFRQTDVVDGNGVYLWSDQEFEQLPPDGTLPVAAATELAAHDRNGDGVLSREELRATTDAMRRVIRGDGTQGNVYASDLEPFLASMAGVDDPTTGAASVVVPFFDLALNPAGDIDLGAADTVIFDQAGQPIGGWGNG